MGQMRGGAVRLRPETDGAVVDRLERLAADTLAAAGCIDAAITLARELAETEAPRSTSERFEQLATIAASDVTVARVVEPHLDARAILSEWGGEVPHSGVFGVYAAEAGGVSVWGEQQEDHTWRLTGTKPWCSLAARLDSALVTAWTGEGTRRLFAVSLSSAGVEVTGGVWKARGLTDVPSGPVEFRSVAATPVGADGWYLERQGFAWGAIGVASVWWGGAIGVARRLVEAVATRTPDQLTLHHLGAVDLALTRGRLALADAADLADSGRLDRAAAALTAQRTRSIVAAAAEEVLSRTAHALGPAPLAFEEIHARRVADLGLYLRQDHAERDVAALGRSLATAFAEGGSGPW